MDLVLNFIVSQWLFDMAVFSSIWLYIPLLIPFLLYFIFFWFKWCIITLPIWCPFYCILRIFKKNNENKESGV